MSVEKLFYDVLINHPKYLEALANFNDDFIVFKQLKSDASKVFFYRLSLISRELLENPSVKYRVSIGIFNEQVMLENLVDTFFLSVVDIDTYHENLVPEILTILRDRDLDPSYIIKTDKGIHLIYLSKRWVISEDNLHVYAYASCSTMFKDYLNVFLKNVVSIDKVMPCDGSYYTRLDGEVLYEGTMYESFYDWFYRFYSDKTTFEEESDFINLTKDFDFSNIMHNPDYLTSFFLSLYDTKYIFNYIKFNCPTLNHILQNFHSHTYDEWKIAVWLYYFLYRYIAKDEKEQQEILSDLLNKAALYKKHTPDVSVKKTKKFFEWFLKKQVPPLFWSCRKMHEVFNCGKCPYVNQRKLPFVPDFVLPTNFMILDDKYYVANPKKKGEYLYVCQFFYPLSVVMSPWDKEVIVKILTFFGKERVELIVRPDISKGLKEADKFIISLKKHFLELIRFFNSNMLRTVEQEYIGVYPPDSPHKYITIEDFSLFTDEKHDFGNLVAEKKGYYEIFEEMIWALLNDYPDKDYFHYKVAVLLALFSIFYLRYYKLFPLNPCFLYFGTSGIGKTTCLKIINAFFREPVKMYEANIEGITDAWINRKASVIRLPVFIDDVKVHSTRDFKNLFQKLYQFANRNLSKLNVQFMGSGNFYWVLFFSAEIRFVYHFLVTDGLNRRFHFINMGFKHSRLQYLAKVITEEIISILEDNYGHGFSFYEKYVMPYEREIITYMEDKKPRFYEIFDIGVHNRILRCLEKIAQILFKDNERAEGLIFRFYRSLINIPMVPVLKDQEVKEFQLAEKYPYIYDELFDDEMMLSFLKDFKEISNLAEKTGFLYETMNRLTKISYELNFFYNILFANLMITSGDVKYIYPDFTYNLFYQVLLENKSIEILLEQILLLHNQLKNKIKILKELGFYEKFLNYLERIDIYKGLNLYRAITEFEKKYSKELIVKPTESLSDEIPF